MFYSFLKVRLSTETAMNSPLNPTKHSKKAMGFCTRFGDSPNQGLLHPLNATLP